MGNINDPNDPYYRDLAGWVFRDGKWQDNVAERNAFREQNGVQPTADGRNGPNGAQPITPNAPGSNPVAVSGLPQGYQIGGGVLAKDPAAMQRLNEFYSTLGNRAAPTVNTGQSDQMRAVQTGLITDLQAQAAGTGPSLAQAQLQKASDQNLANTLSAVQATRGMGATAASASAAGAGAAAGQQMAQDSAIVRLQEQMQARGLLGQLATGTRGQDIGVAAQNALMELQNQQQIDAIRTQLIGQHLSYAEADRQARIQVAGMNQQGRIAATTGNQNQQSIDNQQAQFDRQQTNKETMDALNFFMSLIKMLSSGAGGAAGAGAVTGG